MIGGAGVAAVSICAYWFFNKRLMQKKNPKTSNVSLGAGKAINLATTAGTRQVPNWNNPFDMNYIEEVNQWLHPKPIAQLGNATAISYAKSIKNAKGTFSDDEKVIHLIFSKRLKDKTNVASISKTFWNLYKKDMWQYLASFLSQSEMQKYVAQPVKQLPNYTIA